VIRVEAELCALREQLHTARTWQRAVHQQVEEYRHQAHHLDKIANVESEAAAAVLDEAERDLQRYLDFSVGAAVLGMAFLNAIRIGYQDLRGRAGRYAIEQAKQQEIALVRATGQGTRPWTRAQLAMLRKGAFPKGYVGHHINNVARFPHLAANPDNIRFVTHAEHWALHKQDWHNNTSGRMFNRRSLAVQRATFK
jgi:hypothetical protein